jgi:hypothetical protein
MYILYLQRDCVVIIGILNIKFEHNYYIFNKNDIGVRKTKKGLLITTLLEVRYVTSCDVMYAHRQLNKLNRLSD